VKARYGVFRIAVTTIFAFQIIIQALSTAMAIINDKFSFAQSANKCCPVILFSKLHSDVCDTVIIFRNTMNQLFMCVRICPR